MDSSVSVVLDIPAGRSATASPLGEGSPEARAVTGNGDVVLLVAPSSPAARLVSEAGGGEVGAVMEITDAAPVAVPGDRIRARARIAGWLTAVRPEERVPCTRLLEARHPSGLPAVEARQLLRLEFGEGYIDDLCGTEHIEPDDFAAASPDPLAPHEAGLLQHLASSHGEEMRTLGGLLRESGPGCAANCARAVPLSVDRHGMRVRFCDVDGYGYGADACFDARFEFPEPVADVAQLRQAMRLLFDAAADR